jgi:serine/threonine protein kinase
MANKSRLLPALQPGYMLGKFEIVEKVAQDGQAHVYLARVATENRPDLAALQQQLKARTPTPAFVETQRLCIIKLAMPDWIDSLRDEHGFLLNPQTQHPRIVKLFSDPVSDTTTAKRKGPKGLWFVDLPDDTGTPVRLPYLALVYYPGGSLKSLLEARNWEPLPPASVVLIARQVAEALEHLHTQAGIIHHDIAPNNIVFRQSLNQPQSQLPDSVLIDLAVADMPGKPRRSQIYGRKTYLPPERLLDKPDSHGPLVDVYALGVVMYESLVGKLPHRGTDAINNIPLPLPPIREHHTGISDQLAALVSAAVDHDPAQRPTLRQLINALERTPEATGNPRMRGKWSPRTMLPLFAGAAAVLLLMLVIIGFSLRPQPNQITPTALPANTPTRTLEPTRTLTPTPLPTSTPIGG